MKTSFWTKLFDLISPRLCAICGTRLSAEEEMLCAGCMLHLPRTGFVLHPYDNLMARRFWGQFPVERAAALFFYGPQSELAKVVYDLKYRGRAEIGEYMGRIMARDLGREGFFEGIDVLVPVPVTRWRKWKRGYNQSFMIARGISDMTGLSVYDKVVKRTSFTVSQVGLSSGERRENVKGAFTLVDDKPIAHKHVLLVDDIVTTGSTVIACAQALQKAEDVRISVLSLGFTRS